MNFNYSIMQSRYKISNPLQFSRTVLILFTLLAGFASCKKLIEIPAPVNSLNVANVYTTDVTAASVLTGIYQKMSNNSITFPFAIDLSDIALSVLPGLSGDELNLFNVTDGTYEPYYSSSLTSSNAGINLWNKIYHVVFICNSALEGLANSTGLTPSVKQQLTGEAKFMRAFCYFYMVNLYGDVPLVLSTDYKISASMARTPADQVYQQIITDLKDAQGLLSSNYLDGTALKIVSERLRPTKWAATALLARAYLYNKDYPNAELQATAVINNTSQFNLEPLNSVFLTNKTEAIWQLQPLGASNYIYSNTGMGNLFVLPAEGPDGFTHPLYLSDYLVNSFEAGDLRKEEWTGNVTVDGTTYYYPYKYKIGNTAGPTQEYMMVLRLGEQYLIRAEAEARQNKLAAAITDLNALRTRARGPNPGDLPALSGSLTQQAILDAVAHERQVELFTEWGDRWLDLKRTEKIDAVMNTVATQRGFTWSSYMQLYPIPLAELLTDPNLEQNPGYTE